MRRAASPRRRPAWSLTLTAALLALGLGLLLCLLLPAPLSRLTHLLFDSYQRSLPRPATPATDLGVAVVDIDEASIRSLGQWPWPRDQIGALVERLGAAGAAAIAFDMAFPEPDRTSLTALAHRFARRGVPLALPADPLAADNDLAFAAAIARHPVVLGLALSGETGRALPPPRAGLSWSGEDPRLSLPGVSGGLSNLDVLTEAARGLGSFSYPVADDSVIRRMPLVARAGEHLYPGLGIEALRVAQGAPGLILRQTPDGAQPMMLRTGHIDVPGDAEAMLTLWYSGLPHLALLPAARVLSTPPEDLAAQVDGRVVLIGTSALGLRDLVTTPLAAGVPGVLVHAELVDQILSQRFLTRPDWGRGAELAASALAGLALTLLLLPGHAGLGLIALPLIGGGLAALSWLAFSRAGLLLDPLPALLVTGVVFAAALPVLLWSGNRDRRFVRRAFGRYLSPALVSRLSLDPTALQLGGGIRELTLLFSDIRGFTKLSENMAPDALTGLLNNLLTPLTDILLRENATIDKYIGDAIMAFWNAPLSIADHPRHACRAALAMQQAVADLNEREGLQLRLGIGLHKGPACVGNLGSEQRFSYSAIGDSVNLAARIEGLTKPYRAGILISDALRAEVPEFACVIADRVQVVGRTEPVTLWLLLGDADFARSAEFRTVEPRHSRFIQNWQQGRFAAARQELASLQAAAPAALKEYYTFCAERLSRLPDQAPPGWDGIARPQEK